MVIEAAGLEVITMTDLNGDFITPTGALLDAINAVLDGIIG
tara:strand:+ start:1757 stop:1879 length:123 start_codon:yes stop_codon:yes gene_type:complete